MDLYRLLEEKKKNKADKKISRQGISAEVFGAFNKKANNVAKVIFKDSATKQHIQKLI